MSVQNPSAICASVSWFNKANLHFQIKRRPRLVAALFWGIYGMGGNSVVTSDRLRRVIKPTATGTRIIKIVRHKSVYPRVGDKTCGVVIPFVVISIGVPVAIRNPHTPLKILAHPHARAVITVITIANVLFCISFSPIKDLLLRPHSNCGHSRSATQLRTDLIFQSFDDFGSDRGSFGIC